MNLSKRLKLVVISVGIVVSLNGLYFSKEALACELVELSTFEQIKPEVFVDKTITVKQRLVLLTSIKQATLRVTNTYGAPISNLRFLVSTDSRYTSLGFNPTGMQTSSFARECVFIGPKGLNTDVIAHEYVHAEMRHRVSLLTELLELPAWFIEGIAIMVDHRKPFLTENIQMTDLEKIDIQNVFYLKDFPNTSIHHYQASKVAVEQLNISSLYIDLARLNEGESFDEVFTSH